MEVQLSSITGVHIAIPPPSVCVSATRGSSAGAVQAMRLSARWLTTMGRRARGHRTLPVIKTSVTDPARSAVEVGGKGCSPRRSRGFDRRQASIFAGAFQKGTCDGACRTGSCSAECPLPREDAAMALSAQGGDRRGVAPREGWRHRFATPQALVQAPCGREIVG